MTENWELQVDSHEIPNPVLRENIRKLFQLLKHQAIFEADDILNSNWKLCDIFKHHNAFPYLS